MLSAKTVEAVEYFCSSVYQVKSKMSIKVSNNDLELEEEFILRIPKQEGDYIKYLLRNKPKKVKKKLSISLDNETKQAIVTVNKVQLEGMLKTSPTIIESYKTYNKSDIMKTADVCQIIDCVNLVKRDNFHGITPPLKNVRKKRFRRCLINRDENLIDVQKELFYLIQADLEAVSSRFEIIDPKLNINQNHNFEVDLFGIISSDSEASLSNNEEVSFV